MQAIDRFRLDGRAAIVTGASKGLGASIAEGLASAGADLALCSRDAGEIEAVGRRLREGFGRRVLAEACDVTREDQVEGFVGRAAGELGGIDIVVSNAGINIRGPIEELQREAFEEVMRTNVTGPWLVARAAAPWLKRSGRGRLIQMASTLGSVGVPQRTPYASSKGALIQMTRVLALEWAGDGVRVNAICPGPFLTPMNEPIADTEDARRFILGAVPLGRWGAMEEIQGAAIFLASDASSYVTGSTLYVDGGWTAH